MAMAGCDDIFFLSAACITWLSGLVGRLECFAGCLLIWFGGVISIWYLLVELLVELLRVLLIIAILIFFSVHIVL